MRVTELNGGDEACHLTVLFILGDDRPGPPRFLHRLEAREQDFDRKLHLLQRDAQLLWRLRDGKTLIFTDWPAGTDIRTSSIGAMATAQMTSAVASRPSCGCAGAAVAWAGLLC